MKSAHRKKLERAANSIREVYDDLENAGNDDFDDYGSRLDELATGIDDVLEEDELKREEDGVDDRFQVE
jgi:transcription elongation GreA/GreB family factor